MQNNAQDLPKLSAASDFFIIVCCPTKLNIMRKLKKLNNTPAQYKKKYGWLKEVDSLALVNAQIHLQTAFQNFFKQPKTGFPKFKSKKSNRRSYTTTM